MLSGVLVGVQAVTPPVVYVVWGASWSTSCHPSSSVCCLGASGVQDVTPPVVYVVWGASWVQAVTPPVVYVVWGASWSTSCHPSSSVCCLGASWVQAVTPPVVYVVWVLVGYKVSPLQYCMLSGC
jgi:hypothetical protein